MKFNKKLETNQTEPEIKNLFALCRVFNECDKSIGGTCGKSPVPESGNFVRYSLDLYMSI